MKVDFTELAADLDAMEAVISDAIKQISALHTSDIKDKDDVITAAWDAVMEARRKMHEHKMNILYPSTRIKVD